LKIKQEIVNIINLVHFLIQEITLEMSELVIIFAMLIL